jgi:hypothetical protein
MSELLYPLGAASTSAAERGGWEFLEILATVILAAESLRVVGSVVSGVIFATTSHVGPFGEQQLVGSAMVRAANFSDGPGIVLLLVSLALVWWRAEYWTKQLGPDGAVRAAAIQVRRLRSLARWATSLFTLAAAGAVAFLIGNILVNTAGGVPTSDQWQAYFSDSFSVAYLVIALAGLVATIKLAQLCEVATALDAGS